MNTMNTQIIVEQLFNSSSRKVWNAITSLEEMRQWFFPNIPSFDPVVGFQTKFGVESTNRTFIHLWKIIEVEPERKITYHWSYEEYQGEGFVIFELFERDEQTLLRLTNEGLESFTRDIPEFSRESCQAGWEYFIKGKLKAYLDQLE